VDIINVLYLCSLIFEYLQGVKTVFRQGYFLILASLVFFSVNGLTVVHHICGCPPAPVNPPLTETREALSCCHIQEKSERCSDSDHSRCRSEQHKGCKDRVTYLKAPIISTLPAEGLNLSVSSLEMPDFLLSVTGLPASPQQNLFHHETGIIPPRAGGSLFLYYHCIRIPVPEDPFHLLFG
jgi:hypothetical protein